MAASEPPLATVQDLETRLGSQVPDAQQAAATLADLSALVRAYTGQHLTAVTDDAVTLDGEGSAVLLLPEVPVTAVSSVTVDGETLDADGYTWSVNGVLRRIGGVWAAKHRSVAVTYSHGYDTVPDDVVAVLMSAAKRRQTGPGDGVTREQIGSYAVSYGDTDAGSRTTGAGGVLLVSEQQVLNRYRP